MPPRLAPPLLLGLALLATPLLARPSARPDPTPDLPPVVIEVLERLDHARRESLTLPPDRAVPMLRRTFRRELSTSGLPRGLVLCLRVAWDLGLEVQPLREVAAILRNAAWHLVAQAGRLCGSTGEIRRGVLLVAAACGEGRPPLVETQVLAGFVDGILEEDTLAPEGSLRAATYEALAHVRISVLPREVQARALRQAAHALGAKPETDPLETLARTALATTYLPHPTDGAILSEPFFTRALESTDLPTEARVLLRRASRILARTFDYEVRAKIYHQTFLDLLDPALLRSRPVDLDS